MNKKEEFKKMTEELANLNLSGDDYRKALFILLGGLSAAMDQKYITKDVVLTSTYAALATAKHKLDLDDFKQLNISDSVTH